jgi:GNAT superfamily N-acetyltransferase
VKLATSAEDIRWWLTMVGSFVSELQDYGSEMIWDEKTAEYFLSVANSAVWSEDGALIIDADGFALAADASRLPFSHTLGKPAVSIGVWVRPEKRKTGLGMKLKMSLREALKNRGYATMLVGVHCLNKDALDSLYREPGVHPHQMQFVVNLEG